jgi:hypothetical protein
LAEQQPVKWSKKARWSRQHKNFMEWHHAVHAATQSAQSIQLRSKVFASFNSIVSSRFRGSLTKRRTFVNFPTCISAILRRNMVGLS